MCHGKVRVLRDDLVDRSQRVGLVGMQKIAGLIKHINGLLRTIGNGVTTLVSLHHRLLSCYGCGQVFQPYKSQYDTFVQPA